MVAKKLSQRRAKPSKRNEVLRVSSCVLMQPMHGGDTSTWSSRFFTKSGSIPIVKLALSGGTHIIANYLYHEMMIMFYFTLNLIWIVLAYLLKVTLLLFTLNMFWAILCFVSWVCFWFFLLLYCFVFMHLYWFIHLHVKFSIVCVIFNTFLGYSFFIVWLLKETCRKEFKDIFINFSTCFFLFNFLY